MLFLSQINNVFEYDTDNETTSLYKTVFGKIGLLVSSDVVKRFIEIQILACMQNACTL